MYFVPKNFKIELISFILEIPFMGLHKTKINSRGKNIKQTINLVHYLSISLLFILTLRQFKGYLRLPLDLS